MKNELLWVLMLLVNFGFITFAYKKFGRIGLFCWIPISVILANIQVVLLVDLFGFGATLGNIVYASGFLVTDILSENYGEKDARKAIGIGFFSLIAMVVIMQMAIAFAPSDIPEGIANYESVKTIFSFMPRLVIAGMIAYGVSQVHDVWAYAFWKKRFSESKHIWIRNNLSTMISQIIDTAIFSVVAFWGVFPIEVLWEISISAYVLKWVVAMFDTPFVYLASHMKKNNMIEEIVVSKA